MLAYAAHRRTLAERRPAPNAMLVIVALHVAGIAALMSAKMDLPRIDALPPTIVDLITEDDPPPPVELTLKADNKPAPVIDRPPPLVPTPPLDTPIVDPTPLPLPDFGKIIGPNPGPKVDPLPAPAPVRVDARLITPASRLKPPYPAAKLASGEEALLRLRLTIDANGRVVAVEPVGPAEPSFLEAARRHVIAHWRYKPATEDGRPLATTKVITLRFELEA